MFAEEWSGTRRLRGRSRELTGSAGEFEFAGFLWSISTKNPRSSNILFSLNSLAEATIAISRRAPWPFNDFGAGMLFEPGDQARLNFFPMVMEQPDGVLYSGF